MLSSSCGLCPMVCAPPYQVGLCPVDVLHSVVGCATAVATVCYRVLLGATAPRSAQHGQKPAHKLVLPLHMRNQLAIALCKDPGGFDCWFTAACARTRTRTRTCTCTTGSSTSSSGSSTGDDSGGWLAVRCRRGARGASVAPHGRNDGCAKQSNAHEALVPLCGDAGVAQTQLVAHPW